MTTAAQSSPARGLMVEPELHDAVPGSGYLRSDIIKPTEILAGGAPIAAVAAGTVGTAVVNVGSNDVVMVQWDDTAGAADVAIAQIYLGDDFNEEADELEFRFRVARGGVTANTNLTLEATARKYGPGDTDGVLLIDAIPVSVDLGQAVASPPDYDTFTDVVVGLSGAGLKRRSIVEVHLAPNEAPGSSNFIYAYGFEFRANRHVGPVPQSPYNTHLEARQGLAAVPAQA